MGATVEQTERLEVAGNAVRDAIAACHDAREAMAAAMGELRARLEDLLGAMRALQQIVDEIQRAEVGTG